MRKIVHIDMDAFYAAIEQRDDPSLRGLPIAVGSASGRGVVMTASYEARVFGVRSAMPASRAARLCATLRFVPPRFDVYKAVSRQIREIFHRWTDLVEPLSLDEAYLDVTEPLPGPMTAVAIARAIKSEIAEATGLTASAGVSFNKFLAKMASGLDKPDGLSVIRPEAAADFIAGLPIESFHGVGPATAARLHLLGVRTGADLQRLDRELLVARFGRLGEHFWSIAHARDERRVEPDRPRRSLSVEETYAIDLIGYHFLATALKPLSEELAKRIARADFPARTLTLKIKTADFRILTRRRTIGTSLRDARQVEILACRLLGQCDLGDRPVRLLGLGVANPMSDEERLQLELDL